MTRIVFMGTPEVAADHLRSLMDCPGEFQVDAVYTQPDKRQGRASGLQAPAVKILARELGIAVHQVPHFRQESDAATLRALKPDVLVVVAYGLILPPGVLDAARYGGINIHASLLPTLRGAAPVQTALLRGFMETGVTSLLMDAGIDSGPILLQEKIPVSDEDDAASLLAKCSVAGCDLLKATLQRVAGSGFTWKGTAQDGARATHAPKITKSMRHLDFRGSATVLFNQVRALNQWPICRVVLPLVCGNNLEVLLHKTHPHPQENLPPRRPGEVLRADSDCLLIQTGEGILQILELQPPGKTRIPVRAFLNGHPVREGALVTPNPLFEPQP